MDNNSENKLAYSIKEVMELTGLGRSTIYRAIDHGQLKVRKCGRRTLVLATDLNTFLDGLECSSP
jgi:excisionase family DNA binding protein